MDDIMAEDNPVIVSVDNDTDDWAIYGRAEDQNSQLSDLNTGVLVGAKQTSKTIAIGIYKTYWQMVGTKAGTFCIATWRSGDDDEYYAIEITQGGTPDEMDVGDYMVNRMKGATVIFRLDDVAQESKWVLEIPDTDTPVENSTGSYTMSDGQPYLSEQP